MFFGQSDETGASLVEIMVALFIVGLTASIVVVSIPSQTGSPESLTAQLESQITLAAKTAQLNGEMIGFDVQENSISPVVYRRGIWSSPNSAYGLQSISIDDETTVSVIEDRGSKLDFGLKDAKSEIIEPELWFDVTGISSGVDLSIKRGVNAWSVSVDRGGQLNVSALQ